MAPTLGDEPEEGAEEEEEEEEEKEEKVGEPAERRPGVLAKARREKRKRDAREDDVPSWEYLGAHLKPSQELQESTLILEKEFQLAFADLQPHMKGEEDEAFVTAMARDFKKVFDKYTFGHRLQY